MPMDPYVRYIYNFFSYILIVTVTAPMQDLYDIVNSQN